MFWEENDPSDAPVLPDNVVDVLFSVECKSIPVDHAHALSRALLAAAPWLAEPGAAVHTIHVAGSQNGWERPEHGTEQQIQLSRRTKLCVRVPRGRVGDLRAALEGCSLQIGPSQLRVGAGKERPLSKETTLFARYVVAESAPNEDAFLQWAAAELAGHGIRVRKALCGKTVPLQTPDGPVPTRSLMIADLSPEESILLQEHGLGPLREMGCGIFIPHKGIDAVHNPKR
jgi:CRISPR-associated protein Cas6